MKRKVFLKKTRRKKNKTADIIIRDEIVSWNGFLLLIRLLVFLCENKCQMHTQETSNLRFLFVVDHIASSAAWNAVEKHFTRLLNVQNEFSWIFYEWKGSVCVIAFIVETMQKKNENKIYVANNKLMILFFFLHSKMNNNLSREALKFNKLLYFAWAFYGEKKNENRKNYSYFKSHKKVFPFLSKMCCAKHNNLSSEISFFDWLVYFSLQYFAS